MSFVKQILLDALNPNTKIREEAESKLKTLTKQQGFIVQLIDFTKDPDPRLRKISSIVFKNSVISEYSEAEFQSQKELIIMNIVGLIAGAEMNNRVDFISLLEFILENEEIEIWGVFIKQSNEMLQDISNIVFIETALSVITCIAMSDKVKYDIEKSEMIIGPIFPFLVELLRHLNSIGEYKVSKTILKLITNLHDPYFTPNYLKDVKSMMIIYTVALENINRDDPYKSPIFYNYKKWCIKFFTRIITSYIKNATEKNSNNFKGLDLQNCVFIYNSIVNVIRKELGDGFEFVKEQEDVLRPSIQFIVTVLSDDMFNCDFIKNDLKFLIFDFIYPQVIFNDEDESKFESEAAEFIKEKYNDYIDDLRGASVSFFNDIMSRFHKDNVLIHNVFNEFLHILNNYANNPTIENAKRKYGALRLITQSSKFVIMNNEAFITNYIVPDLFSSTNFLCSQACYSLRKFKSDDMSDKTINQVFEGIYKNLQNSEEIIRAEALFAVRFLLHNTKVENRLKEIVPLIIQTIIKVQQNNEVEALNDLLQDITIEFPDEITLYFPQLINLFSTAIINGISNLNEEKVTLFSSYFDTTLFLLDALQSKEELVYNLYCISSDMMYVVFTHQSIDLYAGAINLFSEIVFSLTKLDKSMWNLFSIIMQIPDDFKYDLALELVSLIDNVVSYGQAEALEFLNPIIGFISMLTMPESSCFMEEDYQYGCTIIDSLMLNFRNQVSHTIPYFIECLMKHYDEIDQTSCYIVNHLDSIMNCLVVDFLAGWAVIKAKNHVSVFIDDLFNARNKFVRVFDKKVSLMFSCILLVKNTYDLQDVDITKFKYFFLSNLETLSSAIAKRNYMIQNNTNESHDPNTNYDEDLYDELEEDIFFITPVDQLNVVSMIETSCNSIGTFGKQVFDSMDAKEKHLVEETFAKYR